MFYFGVNYTIFIYCLKYIFKYKKFFILKFVTFKIFNEVHLKIFFKFTSFFINKIELNFISQKKTF